ncbi:MAG: hypothetical protein H6622_17210 [Halobacteriovoraceae bacterium]|nr:hypothetical protein [Halobacteriovoraceae bacterium]
MSTNAQAAIAGLSNQGKNRHPKIHEENNPLFRQNKQLKEENDELYKEIEKLRQGLSGNNDISKIQNALNIEKERSLELEKVLADTEAKLEKSMKEINKLHKDLSDNLNASDISNALNIEKQRCADLETKLKRAERTIDSLRANQSQESGNKLNEIELENKKLTKELNRTLKIVEELKTKNKELKNKKFEKIHNVDTRNLTANASKLYDGLMVEIGTTNEWRQISATHIKKTYRVHSSFMTNAMIELKENGLIDFRKGYEAGTNREIMEWCLTE